jgi:alpha-ketoglutarate-dependent taurine dioxygenase
MTTVAPETHPYGAGSGRLVRADPGQKLEDLDRRWTVSLLAESGFVLFRGFSTGLDGFSRFVQALSSRVTLDPARSFHGDVAQKVDAGADALGLHIENGNSPFAPDLTWFLCERAARSGSQTTVCDGYRVWDAADEAFRETFMKHDIVYERRVEEERWKSFVHHHTGGTVALSEITVDDILARANDQDSTTITANDDGSITYAHRTPAAHPTLFGPRIAWANSILGPSFHYEAPRITFADGSELTPGMLDEIARLTESVTEDVDWRDGDVALIDNTRVMHGRRPIEDAQRTIYNAQSYLDHSAI